MWYKGKFIWEYKGAHADLDKAYQQLLRYREALGNPPLLITSDMDRIVIHTNFTDTMTQAHEVTLTTVERKGDGLDLLKRVFFDPESFKPSITRDDVTEGDRGHVRRGGGHAAEVGAGIGGSARSGAAGALPGAAAVLPVC